MAEVITSPRPLVPEAGEIQKSEVKTYKVRYGMTVYRKRTVKTTGNKVESRQEVFHGDDPDRNEVELTDHEALYSYAHQIEPLGKGTAEVLAKKFSTPAPQPEPTTKK